MNAIERRLRAAVNPVSTAITGWWCQSAVRHLLTGHGPSARQRRLIRAARAARPGAPDARTGTRDARTGAQSAETMRGHAAAPSAETMRARAAAIDELLAPHDHQT